MSKQIQAMIDKHPEKFDSWHTEMDGYGDEGNCHLKSYWIYCKEGWINPNTECGTIHVKTIKDALSEMRDVQTVVEWEAWIEKLRSR